MVKYCSNCETIHSYSAKRCAKCGNTKFKATLKGEGIKYCSNCETIHGSSADRCAKCGSTEFKASKNKSSLNEGILPKGYIPRKMNTAPKRYEHRSVKYSKNNRLDDEKANKRPKNLDFIKPHNTKPKQDAMKKYPKSGTGGNKGITAWWNNQRKYAKILYGISLFLFIFTVCIWGFASLAYQSSSNQVYDSQPSTSPSNSSSSISDSQGSSSSSSSGSSSGDFKGGFSGTGVSCPACDSLNTVLLSERPSYDSNYYLDTFKCKNCGYVFTEPFQDSGYSSYYHN